MWQSKGSTNNFLNKTIKHVFKVVHSRPLLFYFRIFNTVDSKQMFNLNFADDWIQTMDI